MSPSDAKLGKPGARMTSLETMESVVGSAVLLSKKVRTWSKKIDNEIILAIYFRVVDVSLKVEKVLATLLILNDKREPFISGILCLLERSLSSMPR